MLNSRLSTEIIFRLLSFKTVFVVIILCVFAFFYINQQKWSVKTLRYHYQVKNTTNELIDAAELSVMVPIDIRSRQRVVMINANSDFLNVKSSESSSVTFTIQDLPPYATKIIDLTVQLEVSDRVPLDILLTPKYTQTAKYIEVNSTEVQTLASQFLSLRNNIEYAEHIKDWLFNNVQKLSYIAENRGARYAIAQRQGDCTEHMFGFVSLMRARGISARGVAGFYLPKDVSLIGADDYHNWAEFYHWGRWLLVDSLKNIFNADYENYIVVRFIDGDSGAYSERFINSDPRISILTQ